MEVLVGQVVDEEVALRCAAEAGDLKNLLYDLLLLLFGPFLFLLSMCACGWVVDDSRSPVRLRKKWMFIFSVLLVPTIASCIVGLVLLIFNFS